MCIKLISLSLAALVAMILSGCTQQVHEPWDSTGYFKQERVRSMEQQKVLQERAKHGETDREPGIQQINRT